MKKAIIAAFIASFFLNLIWENGQMFLYQGYVGLLPHFSMCLVATLGDVVIIALIYFLMALVFKTWSWFQEFSKGKIAVLMIFSFVFALIIEFHGLGSKKWAYNELMPKLPYLNVGIAPILQMLVIVPLVFYVAKLAYNKINL